VLKVSIRALACASVLSAVASAQASLTTDRPEYGQGSTAHITGSGYAPTEAVWLVVTHIDPTGTAYHAPWVVTADENGSFTTDWNVCDENAGTQLMLVSATGEGSSSSSGTEFLNHDCGTGVVTSVVGVGGECSAFTPAVGMGPDNYEVSEGGTYVMTIEGVTECTDDTITVFVQSSESGNFCFNATNTGVIGTYVGTFTVPNPACNTMPVSYKCGADATCNHPGSYAASGPTSGCGGVHLRASYFDGSCNPTAVDGDCGGCTPCELVCPPDVEVDCSFDTTPAGTGSPTGCGNASYSDSIAPGDCLGNYVITRTWMADDTCGGTSTCVQTITVTDTTAPMITCPPDYVADTCCTPLDIGEATAVDDCSGMATITNDAPEIFCSGVTVVTWTATDACGNSSSCTQNVTVPDPCVLVCPPDVTVECSDDTSPNGTGTPTGCTEPSYVDDITAGDCDGNYTITRTWSADDGCGGTSTCVQTITVVDTTAPPITCPPDVIVEGCCVSIDIGEATADDECSDVTITNDAPETFCMGTTVVTWTATDECGNSSSCTQNVTVNAIVIDFETDALHGQNLVTPGPETPFTCPSITSGPDPLSPGNGNNGAAIFDSTNGPFGPDPDLNVNQGKILYVQRNGGNSDLSTGVNGPDTWDIPNDDEDGGLLTFDFCYGVEMLSIDLIDIDEPTTQQDADVTLYDNNNLTRVYHVPGGWTANGPGAAAVGTLVLNATGNQPGVSADATETTDAGFDPTFVVKMEVRLGSSGAVDNVKFCPSQPQATVASRNGSGVNPDILSSNRMPVMGAPWSAYLDCTGYGSGVALIQVRRGATSDVLSPYGELLIGGQLLHRAASLYVGGAGRAVSRMAWPIPADLALCGLQVHVQGLCQRETASGGPKLQGNQGWLSNALDLTLGF
jgi:hypothetical protein